MHVRNDRLFSIHHWFQNTHFCFVYSHCLAGQFQCCTRTTWTWETIIPQKSNIAVQQCRRPRTTRIKQRLHNQPRKARILHRVLATSHFASVVWNTFTRSEFAISFFIPGWNAGFSTGTEEHNDFTFWYIQVSIVSNIITSAEKMYRTYSSVLTYVLSTVL